MDSIQTKVATDITSDNASLLSSRNTRARTRTTTRSAEPGAYRFSVGENLELIPADARELDLSVHQILADTSRSVLTKNTRAEIPSKYALSPYRTCDSGCSCCSTVPAEEDSELFAEFSSGPKVYIKEKIAPQLRKEMLASKWKPQLITLNGSVDCYCPLEEKLQLTRRALEIMNEFRNPVSVVTRSTRITRDQDILAEMASRRQVVVYFAFTSRDQSFADRVEAMSRLASAGVPTGILVEPFPEACTDLELPSILKAAAEAGAEFALLKGPTKVNRAFADRVKKAFLAATAENGLLTEHPSLSATEFRRSEDPRQMWLFG